MLDAIRNPYADVGRFRRWSIDGQSLDIDDEIEALAVLAGASRAVDGYCRRRFYAASEIMYVHGRGVRTLVLDTDIASVSALDVDDDDDGTYETSLVDGTDYDLVNIDAENSRTPPFNALRLTRRTGGALSAFPAREDSVRVTGRLGYSDSYRAALTSAGVAVTGTLDSTNDTSLVTSAAAQPIIAPGMTLRIESEDVYVVSGSGTTFVVDRGVNGTTAASHAAAAVSFYVYHPTVVTATLIVAGRFWKRKDAPFLPIIAAPGIGDIQLMIGLDPDVQFVLSDLKRFADF